MIQILLTGASAHIPNPAKMSHIHFGTFSPAATDQPHQNTVNKLYEKKKK